MEPQHLEWAAPLTGVRIGEASHPGAQPGWGQGGYPSPNAPAVSPWDPEDFGYITCEGEGYATAHDTYPPFMGMNAAEHAAAMQDFSASLDGYYPDPSAPPQPQFQSEVLHRLAAIETQHQQALQLPAVQLSRNDLLQALAGDRAAELEELLGSGGFESPANAPPAPTVAPDVAVGADAGGKGAQAAPSTSLEAENATLRAQVAAFQSRVAQKGKGFPPLGKGMPTQRDRGNYPYYGQQAGQFVRPRPPPQPFGRPPMGTSMGHYPALRPPPTHAPYPYYPTQPTGFDGVSGGPGPRGAHDPFAGVYHGSHHEVTESTERALGMKGIEATSRMTKARQESPWSNTVHCRQVMEAETNREFSTLYALIEEWMLRQAQGLGGNAKWKDLMRCNLVLLVENVKKAEALDRVLQDGKLEEASKKMGFLMDSLLTNLQFNIMSASRAGRWEIAWDYTLLPEMRHQAFFDNKISGLNPTPKLIPAELGAATIQKARDETALRKYAVEYEKAADEAKTSKGKNQE